MKKNSKRIFNCVPSRKTENDWSYDDAITGSFAKKPKTIPDSIDLRAAWWTISNQGDTGSCVGWATADALLRWHFVTKKRIKNTDKFSVRFIWMSAKETDEFNKKPTTFIEESGTSLKAALDIARKYGCALEKDLPFAANSFYMGTEKSLYSKASRHKITNYFNLAEGVSDKVQAWKQWIADGNGPILTRLDVDDTFMNVPKTGKLDVYKADTADGGHAIAIVGYTKDRFIIRNSWGTTDWGDKGFGYASLEYASAAFNEAYGISI